MAAKKDFSQVNTGRVYNTIAEATAEEQKQEETEVMKKKEAQEIQEKSEGRKTYTKQEAAELIKSGKTSGRKGLKLPRINVAFTPDVYEYVQIMARVRGETLTDFVNLILRQHMEDHDELYSKAKEFREALDRL